MKSSNITEARKTLALFSNTHITFHSSLLTFWKFDMLTVVSSSLNHKTNSLHFLFITNSIINTTETQRKCVLGLNTHWSTMDKHVCDSSCLKNQTVQWTTLTTSKRQNRSHEQIGKVNNFMFELSRSKPKSLLVAYDIMAPLQQHNIHFLWLLLFNSIIQQRRKLRYDLHFEF